MGPTNQSINVDEDTSLGMLRGQNVTVDGNPPSLIHTHLSVACDAIDHGGQLGAKEENVYAAEAGNVIQCLDDGLLENTGIQVTDKLTIDVDGSATLKRGVLLEHRPFTIARWKH